ncbi:hypothetical protein F4780DRAFT_776928 [Xylariomycetidae sp. FL0641]|nr:hypothetical protein F4780DRAFT_776928 [Xylariomycetidae sp. FL0641]
MDRNELSPFLLQLFYRTGAFHRPDEFTTNPLPPHLDLHTWSTCTLTELAHHIALASASASASNRPSSSSSSSASSSLLPSPAVGTRLAFRLIFADTRTPAAAAAHGTNPHHYHHPNAAAAGPRYMTKDLGSVVIGEGGDSMQLDHNGDEGSQNKAGQKTLADARFVVGDYLSVAILPPLADGSVAPASAARSGRSESRAAAVGRAPLLPTMPPPPRSSENGFRGPRGRGPPGGRGAHDAGGFGNRGSRVPVGEWRRGELPPDPPPSRRPRWRGRSRD